MSADVHPDDIFHVILDALWGLSADIERGTQSPWEGYDDLEDGLDLKTTQEGYLSVLRQAAEFAEGVLSEGMAAWALGGGPPRG